MNIITCLYCDHTPFDNYKELAKHILENKKTHKNKASLYWAKMYLTDHKRLDRKVSREHNNQERQPVTNEQRVSRNDTRRELSGRTMLVPVRCLRCNKGRREYLPTEHTDNPQALMIDNCFVVNCDGCRR